jgi:regulator of sirC expression with transglutaminase-like and TPR domain
VYVVISERLVYAFTEAALSPDPDLAVAALMIARLEQPALDARPYLDRLDAYGHEARRRLDAATTTGPVPDDVDPAAFVHVTALNAYLFGELRFMGNHVAYEDPRNSFLNDVLDRRTGIPITLALLYLEVGRRAGVPVVGVNFPGHFLVRCPAERTQAGTRDLIIDAYNGGALLSRERLRADTSAAFDEDEPAAFDERLMTRATKPQILTRMLRNLKHAYVRMRSFPQARDAVSLLLAIDPGSIGDLRDRGLISYQMRDHAAALRDLQAVLDRMPASEDSAAIEEQVIALRKKAASLN